MKIAHVALYPPKGEKHIKNSGVASYTKNLVTRISASHEQHVVADKHGARREYDDDGVRIHRVFDRSITFMVQVHKTLKAINPDVVHIQQELALYGGLPTAYLLQWLVFMWRKKVTITIHGVVDLTLINREFIQSNYNVALPSWLVKMALRIIYTPLVRHARSVIVHEKSFKDILVAQYGGNGEKIVVVPHGIETFKVMGDAAARRDLELPRDADIVLFVGYATGYKGIDLLLEGFAEYARMNPKAFLVVGAGEHPRLKDTPEYQSKYEAWRKKAAALIPAGQYRWEGFVEADEITPLYSASDVAVFPYQAALASSGPMSMAIGHEKPFLASSVFGGIFDQEILFEKTPQKMAQKLEDFFENRSAYQKYSAELHRDRTWERVAEQTMAVYEITNDGEYDEIEDSITTG